MIQWGILKKPYPQQTELEMVSVESSVPQDHLLRKIEVAIDFSFIHDRVSGLHCPDNDHLSLDPTLTFRALLIGYPFGVRSERQLVPENEVNVAYRWFLRLKITDAVFDASTLSQNRRQRFNDTSVALDIFDHIVGQAIGHGLADGTVLYTDSTHLKANANKGKYDLAMVAESPSDYWGALVAAIEEDRGAHGKVPLNPTERVPAEKQTKVSRTDPDSGYMVCNGKRRASSTSIIAPSMAGTRSSPTPSPRQPTSTTASSISVGSAGSASGSTWMFRLSGRTPAMPRPASPRGWSTGTFSAIAARTASWSRIPALIDAATVTTSPIRDLPHPPAAGLLYIQCEHPPRHHPPCLAGRTRRGRSGATDAVGQGDLQAAKGEGRAILRRYQAALRPSIFALQSLLRVTCQCLLAGRRLTHRP